MTKKGLVKLQLHSFESNRIKDSTCTVRAKASDVEISTQVSIEQVSNQKFYLMPNADKIVFEMVGQTEQIGYFELPMKKIYEFPHKRHMVTVNCITKDTLEKTIKTDTFGSLKLSFVFLENWVGKLDILINKVEFVEEDVGATQRQLYVECTVGDVSSQTTLKKSHETFWYEFKQMLPFTLESIPGKIELIVKDKDMVNDQLMGRLTMDPQKQNLFEDHGCKKEQRYEMKSEKTRVVIYCETIFRLKEVL